MRFRTFSSGLITEVLQVANMLLISNKISIDKNTLVVWLFS